MCRLLGFVSSRAVSVHDVLGEEGLEAFTALTAVHGDGWGMAWHDGIESVHATASPRSAVLDQRYSDLTREVRTRAGLLHLRWATGGLPVSPENTHPFVEDGHAFGHNGHVAPLDRLERLLSPDSRDRLRGDTDSERYFRFVLQCIEAQGSEPEGVARAVGILREEFPDASLNAVMLTPTSVFAVHVNSHAVPPVEQLRRMFESEEQIPLRHTEDYFAMDYRVDDDAVHVVSSGIDPDGWTPVPDDTVARVDLATRTITQLAVV